MRKRIGMLEAVVMVIMGFCVLVGVHSSAEAVIVVRSATVQNGVAVVEGGNAARGASVFWEGALVTQANNGGNFAFQGVVPADCVGSLHEGNPAAAIVVALANCGPVSGAPAPVPQTRQTVSYADGDDGEIQAGVPFPSPRFTDTGDGTVRDNLTGLIWLKQANCFSPQPWTNALQAANTLASPSCGLSDGSVAGDWRLPNVKELQSLLDFSNFAPALPSGHPFSGAQGSFWSSTTLAEHPESPDFAWFVTVSGGETRVSRKDDITVWANGVWPVRGPE